MQNKKIKCAVFDLDGTLLNTIKTINYYLNFALEKSGLLTVTEDECRSFVGDGAVKLIERALARHGADREKYFDRVFADYNEAYNSDPYFLTTAYDGIFETLSALKREGFLLAVLSNKPDYATRSAVEHFLPHIFDLAFGAREGIALKPAPDALFAILDSLGVTPAETAYIGDSEPDILTAKNASVALSISVTYGFRTKEQLALAGAENLVDTPSGIIEVINRKNTEKTVIKCVWEHNGNDSLLYAIDYVGAYTRGESLDVAILKMSQEISSYLKWCGEDVAADFEIAIVEKKDSQLAINDADSDALFENEKMPLTEEEYQKLKSLALKSAEDFMSLYQAVPNKSAFVAARRETFYGSVPRSADEMYEHTKNVNEYYFAEIGVDADNRGSIYDCRKRGFESLEKKSDYLSNCVIDGSYGERWSLRKVLRRFVWHDRIHAKAMYRMALQLFGEDNIINPFFFQLGE